MGAGHVSERFQCQLWVDRCPRLNRVGSGHCENEPKRYRLGMDDPPTHLLEPLASLEEQRRYVVGGTMDEYLLPEELIHDGFRFCEYFERADRVDPLKPNQRETLERLRDALDALGRVPERYDRTNISDLIESDKGWAVMRERAREAIEAFNSTAV